jgi:hypothetical protein
MNDKKTIKRFPVKVHVTPEEKEKLKARAKQAGLSLSRYLLTVGLARQTGIAAERNRDHVDLLEMVLSRLNVISEIAAVGSVDSLMILEKLCQLERHIIMLAPVTVVGKQPTC